MRKLILFFSILTIKIAGFGQTPNVIQLCGTDVLMNTIYNNNPEAKLRIDLMNQQISSNGNILKISNIAMITIPVVVYVVHDNQPLGVGSNIADSQVNEQISALNINFNPIGINFCIATQTTSPPALPHPIYTLLGNIQNTLGIIHVNNSLISNHNALNDQQALINTAHYSVTNDKYLRIWVVKSINGIGNGVLGYSMFPNSSPIFDGVVIRYDVFGNGSSNLLTNFNQGKTLVHEIGHYFGLYHTFEGGCSGMNTATCETAGDRVCDTPPVQSANFSCLNGIDTCLEVPNLLDDINNYMDYGNDNCVNNFR